MGISQSIQKVNFEDLQRVIKMRDALLVNTLPENEQQCLILNTVLAQQEEEIINQHLSRGSRSIKIIIYGKNSNDDTLQKKYIQFQKLGFNNIFVYLGGMFEWLLLQDIYGNDEFMTTNQTIDLLKFKPRRILNVPLLEYI